MKNNPEESMEIMAKYANYKPEAIKGMKTPVYSKSSEINAGNLQDLADKLYAEEDLGKQLNISKIIYK